MTGEAINNPQSRGQSGHPQASEYCSSAVVWLEERLPVISLTQDMYKMSRMFSTKASVDVEMVHCVSDTTGSYIEKPTCGRREVLCMMQTINYTSISS